jgi:hypothetical protein
VLKSTEIELLIEIILEGFIVKSNLLLCVLVAPFESLVAVTFWQGIDMGQFGCRWVDTVISFLIFIPNLAQDLFLLLFVAVVDYAFLFLKFFQGFVKTQ